MPADERSVERVLVWRARSRGEELGDEVGEAPADEVEATVLDCREVEAAGGGVSGVLAVTWLSLLLLEACVVIEAAVVEAEAAGLSNSDA